MTPPTMAGWNLALRFGLEVAAFAGIGMAAWNYSSGPVKWAAVVLAPLAVAIVWGVFNVLNDPSRSGAAPIEVSGWTRLTIELIVLGGGATAVALAGRRDVGIMLAVLIVAHYAASWSRVEWLVQT
jgi:hypothetical protein